MRQLRGDENVAAGTVPTVGFTEEKFDMKGLTLRAVDMSGQERYQELWDTYYSEVTISLLPSFIHMSHSLAHDLVCV